MTNEKQTWMPLWLATYLCVFGTMASMILVYMFVVHLDTVYDDIVNKRLWGCFTMCFVMIQSSAWIWYVSYIRHRYFPDETYSYYIIAMFPIWYYICSTMSSLNTYWNGYFITIPIDDIAILFAILIMVWDTIRQHNKTTRGVI